MSDDNRPADHDATKRHDIPAEPTRTPFVRAAGEASPPPTSQPPAATPQPGDLGQDVERYSPPPEPRPEWSRHAETPAASAPTPERWYEPATAAATTPVGAATVHPSTSRRGGAGTVLGAALLSAVLASGGTVLALNATGSLNRATLTPTRPTGTTVGANNQPVTIDESSATIDVAAAVSPAVVRITRTGRSTRRRASSPRPASAPASSTTPAAGS